jgi:ATP-binding cassette, subfamily B, bacterial
LNISNAAESRRFLFFKGGMMQESDRQRNMLLYLSQKTWRYSENHRHVIIGYWLIFTVAELLELFVTPLLWAKIMNVIQVEGITVQSRMKLLGLLMLTLATIVVWWALHGPARVMECTNAFRVRMNYRKYLLGGIMSLPLDWHANHHSGDTIDKIEKGTSAVFSFSENSYEIIYALVRLIGSYCILVYFSQSAAYIVLGMILVTAWIIMRFDRVLIAQYQQLNRAENQISENVFDAISNITTVIILRVEHLVFRAIMVRVEKPFALFRRNCCVNEAKWFLTNVGCAIMTIMVLGAYFWQQSALTQGVLVGSVYLLIKYLENISNLFFRFAQLYGETLQRKAKVMNAEELAKDFRSESFTNHVLPSGWRQLEVRGLNFSYHHDGGESDPHLENISFALARGERIAFVGESGSGKTTCLKIMRELYQPQSGQLLVDDVIVPEGFGGIARAIALVPQNPEIFATTIWENITLGTDYDPGFVRRYTDMACFTDVAEGLPNGFDSSIKEKGVNLSGGQQQRLALSRGLLACHDKDIVLLDEPTSSLDTAHEMKIYENIFREFRGKTIISSVHRLHLLPQFDRIFMFDGGRIISTGTFDELFGECALFQELWRNYSDCRSECVSAVAHAKDGVV